MCSDNHISPFSHDVQSSEEDCSSNRGFLIDKLERLEMKEVDIVSYFRNYFILDYKKGLYFKLPSLNCGRHTYGNTDHETA